MAKGHKRRIKYKVELEEILQKNQYHQIFDVSHW